MMSRGSESRRIRKTSSVARTDMLVEVKLNFLQHVFRTGIHGPEYMPSTREPIPCAACLLLTFWLPTGCQWRLPTLYQIVVFDRYPLGHRSRAIFFDSLLNVFDIAYNARHGRMTVKKKARMKSVQNVCHARASVLGKNNNSGDEITIRVCMYIYICNDGSVSPGSHKKRTYMQDAIDIYTRAFMACPRPKQTWCLAAPTDSIAPARSIPQSRSTLPHPTRPRSTHSIPSSNATTPLTRP